MTQENPDKIGVLLVGEGGFGPPKLKSNRFTVCPLWPLGNSPILFQKNLPTDIGKIGAGGRTRTPDLLITNQLLYQLSYTSLTDLIIIPQIKPFVKHFFEFFQKSFSVGNDDGRGDRTRTCGILVPNQALYQTELRLVIDRLNQTAFILYQSQHGLSIENHRFVNCYNSRQHLRQLL